MADTSKGKGRAEIQSDIEFVLKLHEDELQNARMFDADHQLAQRIAGITQADSRAFTAIGKEDAMDRELAQVSRAHLPPPSAPSQQLVRETCVSCLDDEAMLDLARLDCGHYYCGDCLSKLFADSMIEGAPYPPRCCKSKIETDYVRKLLKPCVAKELDERKEELNTLNKVYCHRKTCLTFIPKSSISQEVGTCPDCRQLTCTICKQAFHRGIECPEDADMRSLINLAKNRQFQHCSKCWRIVELAGGCYHVDCPCGYSFCYNCGARWGTCHCSEFTPSSLLRRARVVSTRHEPQLPRVSTESTPTPLLWQARFVPTRHEPQLPRLSTESTPSRREERATVDPTPDESEPATPDHTQIKRLLILRGLQYFWTLLIMVLVGNMIGLATGGNPSLVNFDMVLAIFSMGSLFFAVVVAFIGCIPIDSTILIVFDGVNILFFFCGAIAMAAELGIGNCNDQNYRDSNPITSGSTNNHRRCTEAQAVTAFLYFNFVLYIISLSFTLRGTSPSGIEARDIRRGQPPNMSQV